MCFVEDPSLEKWLFICSTSSPVVAEAPSCHRPPQMAYIIVKQFIIKFNGSFYIVINNKATRL